MGDYETALANCWLKLKCMCTVTWQGNLAFSSELWS